MIVSSKDELERVEAGTVTAFLTERSVTIGSSRRPVRLGDEEPTVYYRVTATKKCRINSLSLDDIQALGCKRREDVQKMWARAVRREDAKRHQCTVDQLSDAERRDPAAVSFTFVEFEVDMGERVRLLANQQGVVPLAYTSSPRMAMPDEPEAVPADFQAKLSKAAGPSNDELRERRRRAASKRLNELGKAAERKGVDYDAYLERIERELRDLEDETKAA